jgi:monofunctional glycosyltransferase
VRAVLRFVAWLALALAALFLAVQLSYLLRIWWWKDHEPRATAFMESRLEELRQKDPRAQLQHKWVPYDRISVHLKRAVVAAEDAKFVDHEGFDWEAIEKAREKNERKGRVVAGGSTISQQLAKNLFLSGERSTWRKGQEALITVMIEHILDKRRILEIYLNMIEWGEGVFGAEAAARHYYGTSAAALGPEASARLAAMVPRPRFYDRHRNTGWLERKSRMILERMPSAELP